MVKTQKLTKEKQQKPTSTTQPQSDVHVCAHLSCVERDNHGPAPGSFSKKEEKPSQRESGNWKIIIHSCLTPTKKNILTIN